MERQSSKERQEFDLLAKSVKLNPYSISGWTNLAECYQKRADVEGAIACLENALIYCDSGESKKIILRKLSTCVRQKTCDSQESKIAALLKSLELSKQALKSDLHDRENYYNLAKAYMCLFFVTECVDQQLIQLSRAAYVKALALSEKESSNKDNDEDKPYSDQSDFLFNYSTVLVYLQEFSKALKYLRRAVALDPAWSEPKRLEDCLVDYLKQIVSMTTEFSRSSKKVSRRYGKVVELLKNVEKIDLAIQQDQQRLKRLANVQVRARTLSELDSRLNLDPSRDMEGESNKGSELVDLLHLKLLNTINYNQAMYLTFIAIDQNYSTIVVTIYNLSASSCPTARDLVTIVNPKIEVVSIADLQESSSGPTSVSYKRIDVRTFSDFYLNGHRISPEQITKPEFTVSMIP